VLLLALQQKDLDINNLNKIIPDWQKQIDYLRTLGLKIKQNDGKIMLESAICFTLNQSVPSEIFNDVNYILYKIIDKPEIMDPSTMIHKIFVPNNIDNTQDSFSCINCADPPCMIYNFEKFGSVDKFPNRVCPDDLINLDKNGVVQIDESQCTGCTLCLLRCPFNSISIKNGVAEIKQFSKSEIGKNVKEENVKINVKQKITKQVLGKISNKSKNMFFTNNIEDTLDNFDKKVAIENWDRDKYYVFIRNLFRELGLTASYTGSGGKLRRADVTIESPFYAGIEVKSPAEGDVNVGAIRQAIDARDEVSNTYELELTDTFCAAIAQGVSRGSHNRAISNNRMGVIIPIIRGRILLYLLIKHITSLPQDSNFDLKRLFTKYVGEVYINELKDYFKNYFNMRISQIRNGTITLPIPPQIDLTNKKTAITHLEELKEKINQEIDSCFNSPVRVSRGSYSRNS
jgi:Fe-S-cluster-containing dehydrogenase component